MKPGDTMDLTVKMPVGDVINTLAPYIDDVVNRRVAEIRERQDGPGRRLVLSLDMAIGKVSRAIVRLENSQHSKDERAAVTEVIAAAKELNKAFKAFKKGH